MDQLGKIFAAFGTPKASRWQDMFHPPDYVEYQYIPGQPLHTLFPMVCDYALDLLSKMFNYDPKSRISPQQALEHRTYSAPNTSPVPPTRESINYKVSNFNTQGVPTVLSAVRKVNEERPTVRKSVHALDFSVSE